MECALLLFSLQGPSRRVLVSKFRNPRKFSPDGKSEDHLFAIVSWLYRCIDIAMSREYLVFTRLYVWVCVADLQIEAS
jgi:hypothetical protein